MVNVEALPDKGERLKTQVKELEQALESLSLTAADQPGNVESYYKISLNSFFVFKFFHKSFNKASLTSASKYLCHRNSQ